MFIGGRGVGGPGRGQKNSSIAGHGRGCGGKVCVGRMQVRGPTRPGAVIKRKKREKKTADIASRGNPDIRVSGPGWGVGGPDGGSKKKKKKVTTFFKNKI